MLRSEFDPSECRSCDTCAACTLGIHSCCREVACRVNGRHHGCDCGATGHKAVSA